MTQAAYIIRPAVFAPAILSVVAIILAVQQSWWFLAGVPFIWLGSVCAQPNLNLANGCLAYAAMIVGFVVTAMFRPLGVAILAGSVSGFYVSAFEKWLRMRRVMEIQDPIFGRLRYQRGLWVFIPNAGDGGFMISVAAPSTGPSEGQRDFFTQIQFQSIRI